MNDTIEDNELLAQYLDEDCERAFADLVARHAKLVYTTCRRMLLGDSALAEDASQAVFIAFAQKCRGLRGRDNLGPWFYVTATMVARNFGRKEYRRKKYEIEAAQFTHHVKGESEHSEDQREVLACLDWAIQRLNPEQREAVVLYYLQGVTQQEIGKISGCSDAAVRKRLRSAHEHLRRSISSKAGIWVAGAAVLACLDAQAAETCPADAVSRCQNASTQYLRGASAADSHAINIADRVTRSFLGMKVKMAISLAVLSAIGMAIALIPRERSPVHAQGDYYVVDNQNPQASDSNPGSEQRPWKTILHAAAAAKPGDTIYVMSGDYPERVKLTRSGTPADTIRLIAKPKHSVLMNGFDLQGHSNIELEGFKITPPDRLPDREAHVGLVGIWLGGKTGVPRNVKIRGNHFYKCREGVSAGIHSTGDSGPVDVYVGYNRFQFCHEGIVVSGRDWLVECNDIAQLSNWEQSYLVYCRLAGRGHVARWNRLHRTRRVAGRKIVGFLSLEQGQSIAQDIRIEENMILEVGRGIQCTSFSQAGGVRGWTVRGNVFHNRSFPAEQAIGLSRNQNSRFVDNTFVGVECAMAIRQECDGSIVKNNAFHDVAQYRRFAGIPRDSTPDEKLVFAGNIVLPREGRLRLAEKALMKEDRLENPLLIDPRSGNYRLRPGSPAIDSGASRSDVGAFPYPYVFHVNQRHPAATDQGFGYPAAPFVTISKALSAASKGDTIIVHSGVYRETLSPKRNDVVIKAAENAEVQLTLANRIRGWKRAGSGWSVHFTQDVSAFTCDGIPFRQCIYDKRAQELLVENLDPRLHMIEYSARRTALDLSYVHSIDLQDIQALR